MGPGLSPETLKNIENIETHRKTMKNIDQWFWGGMRRIVVVVVRLGVGLGKERGGIDSCILGFRGSGVSGGSGVHANGGMRR